MSKYKPANGERVRVVYEGEVSSSDDVGFTVEGELPVLWEDQSLVSIEKIEPPVEVFGPGDVVRSKNGTGTRALGKTGYIRLDREVGAFFAYGSEFAKSLSDFTSKNYERVELG